MKIVVCIKQVPNTNEVKINKETGTLIRDGVESIINPDDMNAIELALQLKEKQDNCHITVVTMGPPQAENALREALSMGADEAILLSDRAFAGSDTWATATVLAAAVRKIADYDLVLCGLQAIDGDTAQVGPEIAEFLDLPQVTYTQQITIKDGKVLVHRAFEEGYFEQEVQLPALVTAVKELNQPRFMDMRKIYAAYQPGDQYKVWSAADIEVDLTQIGIKNSPTNVKSSFTPVRAFSGKKVDGPVAELIRETMSVLREHNIVE